MENITDLSEGEVNIGEDTFTCPKCGEPQSFFIDRGHGWVRCPTCDTGVQKRQIPEEYRHLIKKTDYKKKESKREEEFVPPKQAVSTPERREVEPADEIFDRPFTDWEVLGQVLDQFGIPKNVRDFMVKRAERQGTMHPQEVQRILGDMKTNMPKKQLSYVAEEYFLALEAEQEKRRQDAMVPSYPMRRTPATSGSPSFPWRSGQSTYESGGRSPTWGYGGRDREGVLTREDFERMWHENIEKQQQQQKMDELKETIGGMGNVINQLQHQLANPPKSDESDKFYKMIMEQERKSNEQIMALIKEMQAQRDIHSKELIELYKNQATRSSTEGYKEDGVRLAADAMNNLTNVIEKNKPLQTAMKTVAKGQEASQPSEPVDAVPEVDGDVGILSLIPSKSRKKS